MKATVLVSLILVGLAVVVPAKSSDANPLDGKSGDVSNRKPRRCRTGFELNLEGLCVDKVTKCLRGYQLFDGICTKSPPNLRKQRKTDGSDDDLGSTDNLETPPDSIRDARPRVETKKDVPRRANVVTETADPIFQEEFGPVEIEVDTVCPIGYKMVDKKCESIFQCPPDHERRGGMCVKTEIVCPNGFQLENSDCVPIPQCPKHHAWRDGRCVQDTPECAVGFVWNGFQCIIVEKECPPGFTFKHGQCVKVRKICAEDEVERDNICHPLESKCPEGYEKVDGMCNKRAVKCPEGYTERDGLCVRNAAICPDGLTWNGVTCFRNRVENLETFQPNSTTGPESSPPFLPEPLTTTVASVTRPRADSPPDTLRKRRPRCPEGYRLYQGMCYKCKDDSIWCDNGCFKGSSCGGGGGSGQNININVHTNPGSSSGGRHNIINNIEPAENHIFNINNITRPVTLNNVNENLIHIYGNEKCNDGSHQTTVVVNGQRMNGCKEAKKPDPKPEDTPEKCCAIFTPRQCKKRSDETWGCYHRSYDKCGGLCVADQVYLRPKETTWFRGVLTIAPSNQTETSTCNGSDCPSISETFALKLINMITQSIFTGVDCSGCAESSFNCSAQCSTYPCRGDGCVFVDEDEFCGENAGEGVCKYKLI